MSVDATGFVDGDTLAGTMCTTSNDPDTHVVETPVTIDVTAGGNPNIIHTTANLAVPQTTDGLYYNWLTGASCTSGCTVTCTKGCTVTCTRGCTASCVKGCTVSCTVGCTD